MGLVEIIIAFAILMIVLVPISYLLTNSLTSAGQARAKVAALSVAEKWLEALDNSGPTYVDTIPVVGTAIHEPKTPAASTTATTPTTSQPTTHYTTDAGTKYFATGYFYWTTPNRSTHGSPDVCTADTVPDTLELTVRVRWGDSSANVISDTTLTAFPPAGLPKSGFIGVQIESSPYHPTDLSDPVSDDDTPWGGGGATRVHDVPVTITPITATIPSTITTTTIYPSTNGCAFIERPPGQYEVSVGPETGLTTPFVRQGSTTYAQPYPYTGAVTVSVDEVSPIHFLYDEGAYVKVDYPDTTTADGFATCSTTAQLCVATGQSPSGTSPNGSTGTVATTSVLVNGTWSQIHPLSTSLDISRINSLSCTASLCVAVGNGPSGGAATVHAPSAASTAWSASTLPTGLTITELQQVQCINSTSTCIAIGLSATGPPVVLVGKVTGGSITWSRATAPTGIASLSQLVCMSSGTSCLGIGTDAAGGVFLVGSRSGTGTWTWTTFQASGTSTVSQITCPSATTCLAIGSSGTGGPVILSGASATPGSWTWTADTLPGGTSAVTQIACPSTTSCVAIGNTGGNAAVLSGSLANTGQWTWAAAEPTNVTSLAEITCPAVAACLAIGSASTGAAIVSGSPSGSWVTDTPAGASALTQMACPGTGRCYAVGTAAGAAVILSGSAQSGTQTWTSDSLPGGADDPTFFSSVACYKSTGTGTPWSAVYRADPRRVPSS